MKNNYLKKQRLSMPRGNTGGSLLLVAMAIGLWGAMTAGAVVATGPEFEKYKSITDRAMFGEVAPPDTPTNAAPVNPNEAVSKDLEMKGLMDEDGRIKVCFVNKKNNTHLYIGVGETVEGFELVSANYDSEECVLRRGAETSAFSMKKGGDTAGKTPSVPAFPGGNAGLTPPMPMTAPSPMSPSMTPPFPFPTNAPRSSFSEMRKRGFTASKAGMKAPAFKGESIEKFLKEHPEAARQFPSPISLQSPDPNFRFDGKGETIEKFLKEHPEATRQFPSPIPLSPPDPTMNAQGRGNTIETFIKDQPTAVQTFPLPAPTETAPAPDESDIANE
ncbi:MAG: hypothetical protein HY343_08705 [Lentisphaerae bacterium]|nr:hypothetical protein [Lentisphaerota bacterium]